MENSHTIMDGKVHVYRRGKSPNWQCSTYLGGRNHRQTTRQSNIAFAIEFARDWYLDRVAEDRLRERGVLAPAERAPVRTTLSPPRTLRSAAELFVKEYEAMTMGERNAEYVRSKERALRLYILPFMGNLPLSEINAGRIQDYRLHRMTPPTVLKATRYKRNGREFKGAPRKWTRPSRGTIHGEIVCLRQLLKMANRKGWIAALPDTSVAYRPSGKVSHRAWFSPAEFERFYAAVLARAVNPKRERWRGESEAFHDYVVFMVNTGLRPDEARRLEFRDVTVVDDEPTGERILEIEVRGKRGTGYCKSMPEAVAAFERICARKDGAPTDLVLGNIQREMLNAILKELGLKTDRDGNPRTAYSLRHTYICQRLLEGADIYQVAKNCRTSVAMIETYYAAHIKTMLNAAAINVRKTPAKPITGSDQGPIQPQAPEKSEACPA